MNLGKLTSIFYEADEPSVKPPVTLQGKPAVPIVNSTPNLPTASAPGSTIVGVVSDEFNKHFDEILDASKVPGIGYGQFMKQLAVLDGLKGQPGITESQRFEMALKSIQASGISITKVDILNTAGKFAQILIDDDIKLTKLVEQRKSEEITTRQQTIESLNGQILEKQAQIQKLNEEIQGHKTDITTKQNEIQQQSSLIDQRQQNYKATWAAYNNHLQQDIQNISSYLPDTTPAG